MRHLIGIGLAVVLSAAIFFGGGWAYSRLFTRNLGSEWSLPPGGGNLVTNSVVTSGLAVMAGVALLIGLALLIRWVSPLAAGLPGLVLLAWTGLYVASPVRAVHYIPLRGDTYGLGFEAMLMNGVLAAAGLALVVPLFIPSRWRVRPDAMTPAEARDATQVLEPTTISLTGNDDWTTETAPHWTTEPDSGGPS